MLLPAQSGFVSINNGNFYLNNKPYTYLGANYWYGALLGTTPSGKKRLKKELDFFEENGVTNLRVLAAVQGTGKMSGVNLPTPAYQTGPNQFTDSVLLGLDFLISEMQKRNMKLVLYFGNNWEWSGGFLTYLHWAGKLPKKWINNKLTWETYQAQVSKFYGCTACMQAYWQLVENIVTRTNTISKKKYKQDPTIMSWEIANEPRPMMPKAEKQLYKFVETTINRIKKIDKKHLVTTGSEGTIAHKQQTDYKKLHSLKKIDYLTIHIWPKNWQWYNLENINTEFDSLVIPKTQDYINEHLAFAQSLSKPLVLEEFGFPRDEHSFNYKATTNWRNKYFEFIFNQWQAKKTNGLCGLNFWSTSGVILPKNLWWQPGDNYIGDPPQEEQGLYAVFPKDSTWQLIKKMAK
jgi:mannan endo-1,4-beta-mannosidase